MWVSQYLPQLLNLVSTEPLRQGRRALRLTVLSRLAEALAVLGRYQERLDHLGLNKVSIKLIELCQPEVVALKVERRFRRIIRITAQVAEVLHQHKSAV